MLNIKAYEIIEHGIEYSDYFQGCGVAFTKFDECYTGIGMSLREASEDALEQLYSNNSVNDNDTTENLIADCQALSDDCTIAVTNEEHAWYHVSIRIKGDRKHE